MISKKVLWILLLLLLSSASSVMGALPQAVPAGQNSALASAAIDTVLAVLVLPENTTLPVFLNVLPDTVEFGGIVNLVLDYPAGSEPDTELEFSFDADWLVAEQDSGQEAIRDIAELPLAAGPRVVLSARIYQISPFQISSGTGLSRVIHVRGKVTNLQEVAPIRAPRLWGLNLQQLVLIGIILLVVTGFVSWLLYRRRPLALVMEGFDQRPVVWPAVAVRLDALQQSGMLERGETKSFLSELVQTARFYVAGRFLVGAEEMTGQEIEAACLAQGYDVMAVRPFALFIRRVDRLRYNPEVPPPIMCRDEFASFVEMVKAVRIKSEYTTIPASDLLAGQQAWAQLSTKNDHVRGGLS